MNRKIIFIGGVHGVGKGTLCKKLSERYAIPHFSSSTLLRWTEISEAKNKYVNNFDETQNRLLRGIEENIPTCSVSILDGHFTLFNSSGIPKIISEQTFYDIDPIIVSVVKEDASIIRERLEIRDFKTYDLVTIKEMQNIEIAQAKKISQHIGIPCVMIEDGKLDELEIHILEAL